MLRAAYSFLLAALAVTPLRVDSHNPMILDRRQISNTSTGNSGPGTTTSFISIPPSSTTVTSSGRVTSEGSVVPTTQTSVITPSPSVSVSVSSVTSTLTPTNSQGSVTGSPTVVTSGSSVTYSISYSSFVTSVSSDVIITFTTTSNGQVVTATRATNTVVPVTTSARVTAGLSTSDGSNNGTGLSEQSKKIIGGVVGGVGGALLLGALGFTAWRIWGRKKNYHDDDLYDPNSQQEKLSSSTDNHANTPFQSTLDQYHRPGPVNTAANF